MTFGYPLPKRLAEISKLQRDPKGKSTWPVQFLGQTLNRQVDLVSISLPKYRLSNGRTTAAQSAYISKKGLAEDFFQRDPESEEAQKAQDEILRRLIPDANLYTYFKKNKQNQPLYLTGDGFVLNGNRRLCAMRKLFVEENITEFENIQVIILPDCDDKQLSDLEFSLQIRQDIQSDYTWTAQAVMFKQRMQELKYDTRDIAEKANKPEAQIKQAIDMLNYAEDYLKRRGFERQYERVDKKEFAFRSLTEQRKKVEGEDKEFLQQLAYTVIDEPEGGRAYATIGELSEYLEPIKTALRPLLKPGDGDILRRDDLEELFGDDETSEAALITLVTDEERGDDVRRTLVDIIATQKLLDREKKRVDFVLLQVQKANQSLTNAVNALSDEMSKAGVPEQIAGVLQRCNELQTWASNASNDRL